jgi:hypothetical protein
MVAGMFQIVRWTVVAVVAAFAVSAAAQSAGPALLAQAVAATQSAKADYAFDLDIDTSKINWRARYEPSATPQLRLVSPRRDELENDARRAFDRLAEDYEGVSWCASEGMGRVSNVQLVREDENSATYSFQPTRESIRGEQARRYVDRLRGELTLLKATPDISRVRIFTPAAFDPLPLVRVERVNILVTCQAAPNGRRYAAETTTEIRGSAFGQDFDERSVQRARNLQ